MCNRMSSSITTTMIGRLTLSLREYDAGGDNYENREYNRALNGVEALNSNACGNFTPILFEMPLSDLRQCPELQFTWQERCSWVVDVQLINYRLRIQRKPRQKWQLTWEWLNFVETYNCMASTGGEAFTPKDLMQHCCPPTPVSPIPVILVFTISDSEFMSPSIPVDVLSSSCHYLKHNNGHSQDIYGLLGKKDSMATALQRMSSIKGGEQFIFKRISGDRMGIVRGHHKTTQTARKTA
ncbi:hypothetical protein BDZ94DRAFT_1238764 [Collybia nuda]|uniref:Uncharacterized protein n=1 Tax=Collybia nuda TaxID=64659 RepID=A0A9P6CFB8_9AGAR|nr:hypothetical protein BDZ94DRAFT_1238764 [Collybia nuda]